MGTNPRDQQCEIRQRGMANRGVLQRLHNGSLILSEPTEKTTEYLSELSAHRMKGRKMYPLAPKNGLMDINSHISELRTCMWPQLTPMTSAMSEEC